MSADQLASVSVNILFADVVFTSGTGTLKKVALSCIALQRSGIERSDSGIP